MSTTHVIAGGGAAGFFAAISSAHHFPDHRVIILEKSRQLLAKVRISGGGRCNVTHACFEPAEFVKFYPRGSKELRGPLTRFQPRDTMHWFESRGVHLKIEEDGRVFPVSDSSQTIIDCLIGEAQRLGIEILIGHGIQRIEKLMERGFQIHLSTGSTMSCDRLVMATGSNPHVYPLLEQLGHTIVPLVPSLFTFNLPDSPFLDLAGIAVPSVCVKLPQFGLQQSGPLLFTHWGVSGPAVLKLSAWAARELSACHYQTPLLINWVPHLNEGELRNMLLDARRKGGVRQIGTDPSFALPRQLWKQLVALTGISEEKRWADLSNQKLQGLMQQLSATLLEINGKTTYKHEFVTCGGVALEEVNFKTMESRCCHALHFAGEILNIDGVTGGFNFQNAWTTGWIAGKSIR